MIPFIIARLFRALVVLFLTVTFVFVILRVSGDLPSRCWAISLRLKH
jgi:ABC-type dipeptide/oligopeptide/nickel transport system permease component